MRYLTLLTICLCHYNSLAQVDWLNDTNKGFYYDARNGQLYHAAKVKDTWWLMSDMNFSTPNAIEKVIEYPIEGVISTSIYYPRKDLDSVCPSGWRLPIWDDILGLIDQVSTVTKIDTQTKSSYHKFHAVGQLALYQQMTPVQFDLHGWYERDTLYFVSSAGAYWFDLGRKANKRGHLHIRKENFTLHQHRHHIRGRLKKQRHFNVRCVSTSEFFEKHGPYTQVEVSIDTLVNEAIYLQHHCTINTSVDSVWWALTTADGLGLWKERLFDLKLKEGGRIISMRYEGDKYADTILIGKLDTLKFVELFSSYFLPMDDDGFNKPMDRGLKTTYHLKQLQSGLTQVEVLTEGYFAKNEWITTVYRRKVDMQKELLRLIRLFE